MVSAVSEVKLRPRHKNVENKTVRNMATKDKFKSLKLERRTLHDNVINFFNNAEDGTYNYKQVSEKVDANTPKQRALVVEILEELAIDGFLTETTLVVSRQPAAHQWQRACLFAAATARTA